MSALNLPSIHQHKKSKRVGRGYGSGRGKTAGRGTKGQKARGRVKPGFEGGQLRLIKRLPFIRGRGFKGKQRQTPPYVINVAALNVLAAKSTVDLAVLIKGGIVKDRKVKAVKILGQGELKVKGLRIDRLLLVSKAAKAKILKVGGVFE